jgi:hypothetical protein
MGPTFGRALATDAAALAAACKEHAPLARLSWVALLFSDLSQALGQAELELSALSDAAVASPNALRAVREDPAAEILRCAAYLEAEDWSSLPALSVDLASLRAQLAALVPAAPLLSQLSMYCSPALRLRGRAWGDAVWVGCPCPELELEGEHVAWQAAHEATVVEVERLSAERGTVLDFASLEHTALLLLRTRAQTLGHRAAHQEWLQHLSAVPTLSRDALNEPARAVYDELR